MSCEERKEVKMIVLWISLFLQYCIEKSKTLVKKSQVPQHTLPLYSICEVYDTKDGGDY